jgi:predicted PurR-regulated permease PerM
MSDTQTQRSSDLVRNTLQLAALAVLVFGTLWILRPFLLALLWAAMIAIATWPLLLTLQGWLGGRRSLAVTLITVVLLLVLVVPLYLGVSAIVSNVDQIGDLSRELATWSVPQPPAWLEAMPLAGGKLAAKWRALAEATPEELAAEVTPYARDVARWFVSEVGSIGKMVVQFLLTVLFTAILYVRGEESAQAVLRFARRLAGARGEEAAELAGNAVRAVALGVVVTAVVQTVLVGIGFVAAGVPFAGILIAVSFILSIAQIGPLPLLIAAVIWVYSRDGALWGSVFLGWALVCSTVDNVVRPVLIKRGADLPLLLIFAGVIGGLVAFGVVGLFVGPVVLAVGYMLVGEWMKET